VKTSRNDRTTMGVLTVVLWGLALTLPCWALTRLRFRFRFSKQLLACLERRYFACGRIMVGSDYMQSIDQKYPVLGDILAILCAPSCLGAHKMIKRRFLFRTSSHPFVTPILCMWSDHTMIRPHAKYQCNICYFG
jgi:hypothetical protein